jgi:hypothetical protein
MKKAPTKKITLTRETLVALTENEAKDVQGGALSKFSRPNVCCN